MGPRRAISGVRDAVAALTDAPQTFYVLNETPCPYLPERRERKLITELHGPDANALYCQLSRAGFRRSHTFAYRPACSGCHACVPVRVVAREFQPSRSFKRILQQNGDLKASQRPPKVTEEQYWVFERYIHTRHGDGEMAGMTFRDYRSMVEDTRLDTRVTEFRTSQGRLVGACLADWLADGPSAVYSFFDPEFARQSPGTFMVLWLVLEAQRQGLPYTYLGYWIADARKMAYKARFRPIEGLGPEGWRRLPSRQPSDSRRAAL